MGRGRIKSRQIVWDVCVPDSLDEAEKSRMTAEADIILTDCGGSISSGDSNQNKNRAEASEWMRSIRYKSDQT